MKVKCALVQMNFSTDVGENVAKAPSSCAKRAATAPGSSASPS